MGGGPSSSSSSSAVSGLGLSSVSAGGSSSSASLSRSMNKRAGFPVVSTPGIFTNGNGNDALGDAAAAKDTSFHDDDDVDRDTSAASVSHYAIREHEYDEGPSNASTSSTMAFRRSIDAVARGSNSPYSTPLLGGGDSKFSRRNSNDYSPGYYGGRHVSANGLPGSPTTLVNGAGGGGAGNPGSLGTTGKKPLLLNANLSNASIVNMSPVATPTFAPSSMASMQNAALAGNPYAGWKSYLTGKRRIHPLALGPAFLFGVLLALSGLFGSREGSSITER